MRLFSILFLSLLFSSCSSDKKVRVLPFIGNYDVEYSIKNGVEVADTVYPKMIPFEFYDQDSVNVTNADFKGKVWIADFFFTTCPTICPTMTKNLKWLNEQTKDLEEEVQFLSITINPNHDAPSKLLAYKNHYKINAKNWSFLTGDEVFTHQLGIEHFQIFAGQDAAAAGGYAHSGAFTLVDKEGYVRGVYLGTDMKHVKQLEKDLRKLLKYEY
jgi:protein SCO1/2